MFSSSTYSLHLHIWKEAIIVVDVPSGTRFRRERERDEGCCVEVQEEGGGLNEERGRSFLKWDSSGKKRDPWEWLALQRH